MNRSTLALAALLAPLLCLAWTPRPDIIPEGSRSLRWLGTTMERGDFDGAAGDGWLLVVGSLPSRHEEVTLTEPVTDLPFVPYSYLLFALPPEAATEWKALKAESEKPPALGAFAEERGIEGIAFAGSRRLESIGSPARAFRASYRATLDAAGKPGVEQVSFALLDENDEVLRETDVAPEPFEEGGQGRTWTYALVGLALLGGGIWLLTRRKKSS